MAQHPRDEFPVHGNGGQIAGHLNVHGTAAQLGAHLVDGDFQQLAHILRLGANLQSGGIQLGHFDGLADESVEAGALLLDDGGELGALGLGQLGLADESGGGGADGGERGTQVVGNGVEQGGAQALTLAGGFEAAGALEGGGAFESDGDEVADGFVDAGGVAGLGRWPGRPASACRARGGRCERRRAC